MKIRIIRKSVCALLSVLMITSACAYVSGIGAAEKDTGNPFIYDGVPVKKLTVAGCDLSEYVIIHGGNPAYTDCAEHLARYLLSATGIDVPLKRDAETPVGEKEIRVGYTDRDSDRVASARESLGDDGYLIMSEGTALYISGQTARGTCNGVYSFLEDYVGVRFFTRTLRPAVSADLVEVPGNLNVTYVPQFAYRRDNWPDTLDNWTCANKLNGNTETVIGEGVGNVDYSNRFGSVNFYSFTSTVGVWTETKGGTNRQPCLSDETNYQNALKNIREALSHNPSTRVVSVTPYDSDVNTGGCHCDACKAVNDAEGSEMATLLNFCNRLADELAPEYPDVKIETIAYHYTAKPPKTVRPNDRVIVQFAPIQACYAHPLGACDDAAYGSSQTFAYLKTWADICPAGNLWIWDYNADFGFTLAPFTNYDVLYENVHTYATLGVGGVFMECVGSTELGQFTELNHYLLGKLLWNPFMTKDEYYRCMDEFLQAYYGNAWTYIRAYIDKLTVQQATGHYGIWDTVKTVWSLPAGEAGDTLMAELRELWDAALCAVPSDSEYRARVEKSSIHFLYAELCQKTQARCTIDEVGRLRQLMKTYEVTSLGAHSTFGVSQVFGSIPVGSPDLYQDRSDSPDAYYIIAGRSFTDDASIINDCEMTEMSEDGVTFLHMTGKRDPYMNYPNGTLCLTQGARFIVLVYRSDKEQTGRMYSYIATENGRIVTEEQDFPLGKTDGAFKCVLVEFTPEQARVANDFRFDPVDGDRIRNVSLDVAELRFFFSEKAARSFIASFEAVEPDTQPDAQPDTEAGAGDDGEPSVLPDTEEGSGDDGEPSAPPDTEQPTDSLPESTAENETAGSPGGCGSSLALITFVSVLCVAGAACAAPGKRKSDPT